MSKTLSLDTKTVYQLGLGTIACSSLIVVVLVVVQFLKLNYQPKGQPAAKLSEQQLKNAVEQIQKPID